MIALRRIEVAGQRFVLLPEAEYDRLCSKASEAVPLTDDDLPSLPKADKQGRFPAVECARASLARDVVRDRRAAGLTQKELAALAGTRQETISRIESGKCATSHKLIARIDRALQKAMAQRKKRR
jgi:DNA-binding XRE family transcriptional regulator